MHNSPNPPPQTPFCLSPWQNKRIGALTGRANASSARSCIYSEQVQLCALVHSTSLELLVVSLCVHLDSVRRRYPAVCVECTMVEELDNCAKVIVVGNGRVGKSSLIQCFCKGTFTRDYKRTIGVDFLERTIK